MRASSRRYSSEAIKIAPRKQQAPIPVDFLHPEETALSSSPQTEEARFTSGKSFPRPSRLFPATPNAVAAALVKGSAPINTTAASSASINSSALPAPINSSSPTVTRTVLPPPPIRAAPFTPNAASSANNSSASNSGAHNSADAINSAVPNSRSSPSLPAVRGRPLRPSAPAPRKLPELQKRATSND